VFAEFKEFINRGNFIDLAVGFVMGVAVTGVVNALVQRVVMPVIGLIFGEPDFDNVLMFGETVAGTPVGSVGAVITALVTFVFVALVLFFIVKGYNRMQRQEPDEPEPAAEPEDVVLLREILEELRAQRTDEVH
jgi:large conductance mechanosensitive channel